MMTLMTVMEIMDDDEHDGNGEMKKSRNGEIKK